LIQTGREATDLPAPTMAPRKLQNDFNKALLSVHLEPDFDGQNEVRIR
jgi:hypothetical protein